MTQLAMPLPLYRRITLRMVILAAVVLVPIGAIMWMFLDTYITKGIRDRGDFKEVDLKAMSDFRLDPINGSDMDIPRAYRELHGQRVLLRGEVYLPRDAGNAAPGREADFQLVWSIQKCCFSGQPKIQHFVKAQWAPSGRRAQVYYGSMVDVLGTLHVGVERDGEQILSVYRIDVERVQRVQ